MPAHVRKGDTVMIRSGALKGQVGEVLRVVPGDVPEETKVYVKGLNLVNKHMKPTRLNPQGAVITKEAPLHISKVSPVVDGKPTRVGFRIKPDGTKVRVARHAGKDIKELGTVSTAKKARNKAKTK
jgi:large subunit ribosomal protein L24